MYEQTRLGSLIGGRFILERLAGSGGMGDVYQARDVQSSSCVAVKVLRGGADGYAGRFQREARTLAQLAQLDHPGIVRYVASGSEPNIYLAMEWLDGEDLGRRLTRGPLSVGDTISIGLCIAGALSAAHARGIVHRDIKPNNIFLVQGQLDKVKLLDFGIAFLTHSSRSVTATGQLLGTIGYMAPEQARNGKEVTGSADVFSLGCVLFECISGQRAFQGEWVMEVLTKLLQVDPPRLSKLRQGIPKELDELVARMMSKRPDERPQLAQIIAVLESLHALYGGGGNDSGIAAPLIDQGSSEPGLKPAVTSSERRLGAFIVAEDRSDGHAASSNPTMSVEGMESAARLLGQAVYAVSGQLGATTLGAPLVTLHSQGLAVDLAARAARCSLALRRVLPAARIAVAMGSSDPADEAGTGEGVERAERILETEPDAHPKPGAAPKIVLHPLVAGLLDRRFETTGQSGRVLSGERAWAAGSPPSPFVGRERELSLLQAVADECLDEPIASIVLVIGGVRVGKSRLLRECLKSLDERRPRVEVWTAHAEPTLSPRPLSLLGQLVASMAGVLESDPASVRKQKLEARVRRRCSAQTAANITKELLELPYLHVTEEGAAPAPARQDTPQIERVTHAFADLLNAESAGGPVAIVLDDLQWSDAPSVRLLGAALRLLANRPVLVLAAARPEVHDVFPKLWVERHAREIRLAPLTPSASRRLIVDLLGERSDRGTVDSILDAAAGNPCWIEELVQACGRGESAPATLVAVAQAGLEQLEGEQRRVLRAASIFGQTFYWGGVLSLLGTSQPEPLRAALDALIQQEFVVRMPESRLEGQEQFAFRRQAVRCAAYEMLTTKDRKAGHKRAAEWLESSGARDAFMLATHLERADEPNGAIVWYLWAAEQALEAEDLAGVVVRVERGVACGAQGAMLGELRLLEAEAAEWSGRGDAAACAAEALKYLSPHTAAWCRAVAALAIRGCRTGAVQPALLEELLSLPVNGTVGVGHALAMAQVAVELMLAGEPGRAARFIQWIGRIAPVAYEEDLPILKIVDEWLAATAELFAERPERLYQKGMTLAQGLRELGQGRMSVVVQLLTAIAASAVRDFENGSMWASEATALARRAGRGPWMRRGEFVTALHLLRLGHPDEARAAVARSLDSSVDGSQLSAAQRRAHRLAILAAAGDLEDADSLISSLWPAEPAGR